MSVRLLTSAVLGGVLVLGGCSSGDPSAGGRSDDSPSASPSRSSATAPSGPAPLASVEGGNCFSTKLAGPMLVTALVPERPRTDITLRDVQLVDGGGVEIVRAWATPTRSREGGLEVDDWPPRDNTLWKGRTPIAGTTVRAGTGFAVLLHLVPTPGATEASYRSIEVTYDAAGTTHTARLGSTAHFGSPCPLG